ncbi:MAG TPA: ATP-binding protein [Nitriliruptorales bacterium]
MALICPVIIGRDAELARLNTLVDGLSSEPPTGGALVVRGEAGVGKSRLVRHLAQVATTAGHTVLVGRSAQAGRAAALAPIQQALLGLPGWERARELDALAGLAPLLAHLLPMGGTVAAEPSPVLLAHAALRALVHLAAPVVVILEDLHDADPDTLSITEYLVDRVRSEPIVLVMTARPEGAHRGVVDALAGRAEVMDLARLDPEQARAAAAACLDMGDDPLSAELRDLMDSADGLPLLVEDLVADALARDLVRADGEPGDDIRDRPSPTPARFVDLVSRRLDALDEPTRRVVASAAVLGQALESHVVSATTGLDPGAIAEGVRAASDAQLLTPDGRAFRHALTRTLPGPNTLRVQTTP